MGKEDREERKKTERKRGRGKRGKGMEDGEILLQWLKVYRRPCTGVHLQTVFYEPSCTNNYSRLVTYTPVQSVAELPLMLRS